MVDAYSPTPPNTEPVNVIGKAAWSRDAEECCNRCIANRYCKSWTRTGAGQCSLQAGSHPVQRNNSILRAKEPTVGRLASGSWSHLPELKRAS